MAHMRILFVGESWLGSCARTLKEALTRHPDVVLDEVNEDIYVPKATRRWLRAMNRLLFRSYQRELQSEIICRIDKLKPDVIVAYKGSSLEAEFVRDLRARGCRVANVYPDCSPHAHGAKHRQAVGAYDIVMSTKPFHPGLWGTVYGYDNLCVFIPQGYDPRLHLVETPATEPRFDVVLAANWRPEYGDLMKRLGVLLSGRGISVAIGGRGWGVHQRDLPPEWLVAGAVQGHGYVQLLRQGRICLAPVTRHIVVNGTQQPGDEDSTRTYELAAAHCFFIHRRTDFVRSLYDESSEVPMYDTPEELAEKILHFLPLSGERTRMAAAAHRRAVPAYGMDSRADLVVSALADCLGQNLTSDVTGEVPSVV